eukprot:Nitzschia sp. Nitz4//scaffold31_size150131//16305//19745//NITZ4_002811-RA/size150131-augustus-gene-0.0-mRNA-1//1//CDS//3329547608//8591//frame0
MMRYTTGCVVAWLFCLLTLASARQNQMPATYEDDVYHCSDPTLVYVGSISCDSTTWMWNINELSAGAPPESCGTEQDVLSMTAAEIQAADNAMEPCVLWAMFYGHLQPTAAPTAAPTETVSYPDDLYHCRDPSSVDLSESISCDERTHLWNVDELRESAPPSLCGATFYIEPEQIPDVQDWFEPCVLWAMTYGNLKPTPSPTAFPSMAPTTSSPTASPTAMPTPFTTSSPTTSPTEAQWIDMEINPLTISLVWSTPLDDSFSLDRNELKELTQNHILESLRVDLGQDHVHAVSLKITPGVPKTYSYSQTLSGNVSVVVQSEVTASKLQAHILEAFQDNALVLYIYRLQIADDEFLSRVTSVTVGTTVDDGSSSNSLSNNNNDNGDSDGLGVIMLTVLIGVTALVMAFLLVAYCMLCKGSSKTAKQALEKDCVQPFSAAPMGRGRDIPDIPAIPTQSSSMEDPAIPNIVDDDEEMQRSLSNFTASEIDERSHEGGEFYTDNTDEQSVGTSVYSYYNAQDDKSLAGNSVANSIFTSILDSSKSRKKGMLWSVMDTLQNHFGNDSLDLGNSAVPTNNRTDVEERTTSSAASGMLGPSVTESDVDSVHSSSLIYHDGSTDGDGTLDDNTDDGDHYNTPVKDRLEQLWLEDDVQLSDTRGPVDLQATLKKSNVASSRDIDDDAGEVSDLPTHGLDTMYENSPMESNKVLLPGVVVESVQPVAESMVQSPQDDSKVVNPIQEDDDDVVVPLPFQLNANIPQQANDDCQSVASSQSSVSNFSENSGRRQLFDGTSSPDGSVQGQSARGRRSNWGHQSDRSVASTSAMSTDSAKYRSLLSQEDTNDAALFGLQEKSISADSMEQPVPLDGPIADGVEEDKVSPTAKLSSLIESFDKVWAGEMAELGADTSGEEQGSASSDDRGEPIAVQESIFKPQPPRLSSRKPSIMAPIDLDSDEDIYVEDDDDEEDDDVDYASDLKSEDLTPETNESETDVERDVDKPVPKSDVVDSSEQEDATLDADKVDNTFAVSEVPEEEAIQTPNEDHFEGLDLEEVPTDAKELDNEMEVPEASEEETTQNPNEEADVNEGLKAESSPDEELGKEHEESEMSLPSKVDSFDEDIGPNMAMC